MARKGRGGRLVDRARVFLRTPPFFIVGAGRTGTTLLRRILAGDPSLVIPPENYQIAESVGLFASHGFAEAAGVVLDRLAGQDNWRFYGLDAATVRVDLQGLPVGEEPGPRLFWAAFHALYAEAVKPGASRWADKTPLNVFHLDALRALFPGAVFVNTLRNPYDVCASYAAMPGREGRVEEGAKRWRGAVVAAESFQHRRPEAIMSIRFEDLLHEPEPVLRAVCSRVGLDCSALSLQAPATGPMFADIRGSAHLAKAIDPPDSGNPGKGRLLTTQQRRAVEAVLGGEVLEFVRAVWPETAG